MLSGSFDDLGTVAAAFDGCYGAWVNIDTYTVGEQKEIYTGIKFYEAARRTKAARHMIWSNLDYGSKVGSMFAICKLGIYSDPIRLAWKLRSHL